MKVALKNLFLFKKLQGKWKVNDPIPQFIDTENIIGSGDFELYLPVNFSNPQEIKLYYHVLVESKMNVTMGDILSAVSEFYTNTSVGKQDIVNISELDQMEFFATFHLGNIKKNKALDSNLKFYHFLQDQLFFKNIVPLGENVYVMNVMY
jgi:hypothetical protein